MDTTPFRPSRRHLIRTTELSVEIANISVSKFYKTLQCNIVFRDSRITENRKCLRAEMNFKPTAAYPGILFRSGGQQIQLRTEDRQKRDLGVGSSVVRGSGGSCNLAKTISIHTVKFS